MNSTVKSLQRLISIRNLVAIAFAYVFEVKIAYGLLNIFYWLLYILFVHHGPSHWIVTEHWLDKTIWTVFLIQVSVPLVCQGKIELGTKNKEFERWLNIALNFLMWPMFASMSLFFTPSLRFVQFLRKYEQKYPWTGFLLDAMYVFLTTIAVFTLGVRIHITGLFPKRESFLKQFWRAFRGLKQLSKGLIINFGHEGMLDYFIWPYILWFLRAKIIAGANLLKYWVVGGFIAAKSILVDRNSEISRGKAGITAETCINNGISVAASAYGGRRREEEEEIIRAIEKWEDGLFALAVKTGEPITNVNITQSGKFRPALSGVIPEMPEDKWERLFWLADLLRDAQWYCNFLDVYADILPSLEPLPLLQTEKKALIQEIKEKTLELKIRSYKQMKAQKIERLAWIEANGNRGSWLDKILSPIFSIIYAIIAPILITLFKVIRAVLRFLKKAYPKVLSIFDEHYMNG